MSSLKDFIYDAIREKFGVPARLIRLLTDSPAIRFHLADPKPVIAVSSVVRWHEWGAPNPFNSSGRRSRGRAIGWKKSDGRYCSFEAHLPPIEAFGRQQETLHWSCDIQQVEGLGASKSNLYDFTSMDDMVERNSREMIDDISQKNLEKNLAHKEIRIIHSKNTSDHFDCHLWDGRLFLCNSGGSHHFAAARYIASRLGQKVALQGRLCTSEINEDAVAALRRDYEIYVISDEPSIAGDFHDAMGYFGATYIWLYMPRPYEASKAILLPRNQARSMSVASALHDANIFDLGAYLSKLCARQKLKRAA